MKVKFLSVIFLVTLILSVTPVFAVKPAGNLASAEKIPWNLSAEVMKVPPYGSRDIPGSDDASKLIVNQPNGNVEVVITGAMNGLNPNTVYTVYLSKGYTKYWHVVGSWELEFDYLGSIYPHDMSITTETDTTFSGTGSNSDTWVVTGTKGNDGTITMRIDYDHSSYYVDVIGTIDSDGSMSGTWSNPTQQGTWQSVSGSATFVGDGWSGLFTSTIQPFTFTTNEYGTTSWHLNLRDSNFPETGSYTLSVWINEAGGTMLISDNFIVEVD